MPKKPAKKPIKKSKPKRVAPQKRTLAHRLRELADHIDAAFDGATSKAHQRMIAEDLMGRALTYMSIIEGKPEGVEPMLLWGDDPMAALYATVSSYSQFMKMSLEDLVGCVIARMPHIGTEVRWN